MGGAWGCSSTLKRSASVPSRDLRTPARRVVCLSLPIMPSRAATWGRAASLPSLLHTLRACSVFPRSSASAITWSCTALCCAWLNTLRTMSPASSSSGLLSLLRRKGLRLFALPAHRACIAATSLRWGCRYPWSSLSLSQSSSSDRVIFSPEGSACMGTPSALHRLSKKVEKTSGPGEAASSSSAPLQASSRALSAAARAPPGPTSASGTRGVTTGGSMGPLGGALSPSQHHAAS